MERRSMWTLILVPAVITLGVTLLRLVGELNHWSPRFFSREPGGGGAIVGIVWLVPIFGVYFALRLLTDGRGPASKAAAVVYPLAGFAAAFALTFLVAKLGLPVLGNMIGYNLALAVAAVIAWRGWPELSRTNFAYGLAARIPVAILMLVAIFAKWGTHYEGGPPGFPEMAPFPTWLWIGLLPQLVLWVAFTLIVGGLFGGLAAAIRKRA